MRKHRAQVFQVQQKQPFVIGELEQDVEDAFLGVVEFKKARQEKRSNFGNCRPDRMALFSQEVPENRRHGAIFIGLLNADFPGAFFQKVLAFAGNGQA